MAYLKEQDSQSSPRGAAEARSHLSKATDGAGGSISVLGHLLLAELEASGDHKKRGERISRHLDQVCSVLL